MNQARFITHPRLRPKPHPPTWELKRYNSYDLPLEPGEGLVVPPG